MQDLSILLGEQITCRLSDSSAGEALVSCKLPDRVVLLSHQELLF